MGNKKLKIGQKQISRVLIANRGEIALRIRRAALKLGITPVMVASEADRAGMHATQEGEVLFLEGNAAKDTYLNQEKIVELARKAKCDALHPGYGFLSENSEFAARVEEAGITFVGPSSEVIRVMGDKLAAKELAGKAGVPLAPSLEIDDVQKAAAEVGSRVGYPLILKAKAGGGGRGMRLVRDPALFSAECERAQAEALKFFSNATVFAEKYIELPRHVEVQVFGDSHGNVVHLGTRDCSAQRRHQKLVEEAPAPDLSPAVRERLHTSAAALAKQVGYEGAGTVEFLVKDGEIFFLEMNTRIQVEHPVTETIYGIDLVEWQFRVAQGEPLDMALFAKEPKGHAIEFRVYAEDPANNFAPDLGEVRSFIVSESPFLREDGCAKQGVKVSPYYDALLTKLIVTGENREDALQNSRRVLKETEITGLKTTLPFHLWLTHESTFSKEPLDIGYLDREFSADTLKNVSLYARRDPSHQSESYDVESIEKVVAPFGGKRRELSLLHRKDGLFEARAEEEGRVIRALSQTKQGALLGLQKSSAHQRMDAEG